MRLARMSLIAATAMILTGCASTTTAQRRGGNTSTMSVDHQIDHQKMAAVDKFALSRGVRVFWVNPPEK